MDWTRLGRNVLFSIVILAVVFSISRADLPMTHRVEEYIAYVLTTEWDYRGWIAEADGGGYFDRLQGWSDWVPWWGGEVDGTSAKPAASGSSR